MFRSFFQRSGLSKDFGKYSGKCYHNVRCGILHQGESRGGWRIQRNDKLFDENKLTINATKFQKRIAQEIDKYCAELENSKWDDQLWTNFRKKMKVIIKNCGSH